jgi:hypothetical protein
MHQPTNTRAIIAGRWLRRLRCALPEPLSE